MLILLPFHFIWLLLSESWIIKNHEENATTVAFQVFKRYFPYLFMTLTLYLNIQVTLLTDNCVKGEGRNLHEKHQFKTSLL